MLLPDNATPEEIAAARAVFDGSAELPIEEYDETLPIETERRAVTIHTRHPETGQNVTQRDERVSIVGLTPEDVTRAAHRLARNIPSPYPDIVVRGAKGLKGWPTLYLNVVEYDDGFLETLSATPQAGSITVQVHPATARTFTDFGRHALTKVEVRRILRYMTAPPCPEHGATTEPTHRQGRMICYTCPLDGQRIWVPMP
jgi:hypothetical protein